MQNVRSCKQTTDAPLPTLRLKPVSPIVRRMKIVPHQKRALLTPITTCARVEHVSTKAATPMMDVNNLWEHVHRALTSRARGKLFKEVLGHQRLRNT